MNKSKIFAFLVVIAAAISMTSCNRGAGCPGENLQISPAKIVSSILK